MRKVGINLIEHGIKYLTTRNFGRFLFLKRFDNLKIIFLCKLFELMELSFERKNLSTFLIGRFADV
ncbi:MAG: hypothetical protein AAB420_03935 [Patescibacteria group bacterium]